jgi:hypothetical protein
MTTLGYGDVTPVSSFAKSTTTIIAVAGQLLCFALTTIRHPKILKQRIGRKL